MTYGKDAFIEEFKEHGFIAHIRNMDFRVIEGVRMIEKVRHFPSEDLGTDDTAEIIELLWSVPYYALRYEKFCVEMGADPDEYDQIVRELQTVTRETMKTLVARLRSLAP